MSKIILEFDGDTESDIAELAMKSVQYWSRVDDIRNKLRDHFKYDKTTTLDEIYDLLNELQSEYQIR